MPYIHAGDVAEAAVRWLKDGQNDAIFNVTPTICMRYKDWYVGWGKVHGTKIKPVFIRGSVLRLAAWAASLLKKMLGKSGKVDVRYAIASSTRDLIYHSTYAAKLLLWKPTATDKYLLVRK
jgi:nucleoside-diphosphate-sugar epimerase